MILNSEFSRYHHRKQRLSAKLRNQLVPVSQFSVINCHECEGVVVGWCRQWGGGFGDGANEGT